MRKRSPDALYCATTASKRGIWPGFAPMPIPTAETEPSAWAGAETNAPAAQASIMVLNDRVTPGDFFIEASRARS
jgi:hypothetical protein